MLRPRTISAVWLLVLSLSGVTGAEEDPWQLLNWGVLESVRTFLHPATRIEFTPEAVRFRASKFQYSFHRSKRRWEVVATEATGEHFAGWGMVEAANEIVTSTGRLTFSGARPGELEMKWQGCPKPIGPLRLWTAADLGRAWLEYMRRAMHKPSLSSEQLVALMDISAAQIMAWDEDDRSLWLGVGFYAGEGSAGIGTILQLDKTECSVQIHQPPELGLASIMHLSRWKDSLWLATGDFGESGWGTRHGLLRYEISSGHVERLPKDSPLAGAFITAMARQGATLWLATPGRFFALNLDTRELREWRIVHRIELKGTTPAASRPGGEVRSWLNPGAYEVRWVGPDFAEVLAPHCVEGFGETHLVDSPRVPGSPDLMDVAAADKWGMPYSIRLYTSPPKAGPRPAAAAWFFRVPVEQLGSPEGDWQRARVCAGWVKARPEDVRLTVEEVR